MFVKQEFCNKRSFANSFLFFSSNSVLVHLSTSSVIHSWSWGPGGSMST